MGFPFTLVMAPDEEVAKEPNGEELSLLMIRMLMDSIRLFYQGFLWWIRGTYQLFSNAALPQLLVL